MVSAAISRYVVSLPPVIVTTPLVDRMTRWRRERSAVRRAARITDQRSQARPCAGDVVGGDVRRHRAVDGTEQVLDVLTCALRIIDRAVVVGVGGADVGEVAPRHHEDGPLVLRDGDHRGDVVLDLRPRDRDVNALGRADRVRVFGLVEGSHFVGPHATGVDHRAGADVERFGAAPFSTRSDARTRAWPRSSFEDLDDLDAVGDRRPEIESRRCGAIVSVSRASSACAS